MKRTTAQLGLIPHRDRRYLKSKADDPITALKRFQNEYLPRIAVTVDTIATGTDVKPLEVV